MESPIRRNYVKATNQESGSPRYSHNWMFAKRTFFSVYADRLEINGWVIPFDAINDIILYKAKGLLFTNFVLEIQTAVSTYQVGFNPWVKPTEHIPLEIREENVEMQYSLFSIILRLALVGYLLYELFT